MGLLGRTKFHANRLTGVGMRPQISKIYTYTYTALASQGRTLDRFLKFLRAQFLYAQLSCISVSNLS